MRKSHRFYNMYLTTTVSVMLVLVMIGAEAILMLSAGNLVRQARQNLVIDVVLQSDADSLALKQMDLLLQFAPYSHEYRYISKEEALADHIESLGEDPSDFLGYNPLQASYEVHLTADYANVDSVDAIVSHLTSYDWVSKVVYQRDLIALMNRNISYVTVVLLAAALVLLLIALVLIVNTVRLQIYSKRFLINTMSLVGATGWHIRKPFVGRYVVVGLAASVLAIAILAGVVYYVWYRLGLLLFPLTWQNLVFIVSVLLVCGVLICMLAALFATGRYIRMKTNTMYEI